MRIRIGIALVLVCLAALGLISTRGRALPLGIHTLHADDQTLQQVHALGAQYIVQVFSWSEIEPSPGQYHWEYTDWLLRAADYYDLRVIARLDKPPKWAASVPGGLSAPPKRLDDYGDFVAAVAARYRGKLAGYIIWNEPNLAREWGNLPPDPSGYVQLLRVAATRIREVDPHARIVSAGLAPNNEHNPKALDGRDFLRGMYAAGARDYFDVLGAHPYAFANPPDDPRGAHEGLNYARLEDFRDSMVAYGDAAKPVWVTEFGYTTNPPPDSSELRVTEAQQGDYIPRAFELARERWDWVQLFAVWNIAQGVPPGNDGAAEQFGYNLLRADGSPKPAFDAVRTMQKEPPAAAMMRALSNAFARPAPAREFLIQARDAVVHLGDSDYPLPWVPLYQNRTPSTDWQGEFYLRDVDLSSARRGQAWTLTMELMQVNDFDARVLINDQLTRPAFLPVEDFTSVWASAQFEVPASALHVGHNTVTLRDGKAIPAFQEPGYTWDDFQVRNVILTAP